MGGRRMRWLWVMLAVPALTACGGGGGGAVGGRETPPAPEILVRDAAQLETPPASDGTVAMWVRVRRPAEALDRLGAWTSLAEPEMNGEALKAQLAQAGLPPAQMTADTAVIAGWKSAQNPQGMSFGGWLPMPSQAVGTPMFQTKQDLEGGTLFTISGVGPEAVAVAAAIGAARQAEPPADLEFWVDMKQVMAAYGPMVQMMLPMMMAQANVPGGAGMQQQMAQGIQAVGQVSMLSVTADFAPEALDLGARLVAQPGTALADAFTSGVERMPELTEYLTKHEIVAQMNAPDPEALAQKMTDWVAKAAGDEAAAERLRTELGSMAAVGALSTAVSVALEPKEPLKVENLMVADNPEALMEFIGRKIESINAGELHKLMLAKGFDVRLESKEDRSYRGWPVDAMLLRLTTTELVSADDKATIEALIPGGVLEAELAHIGPFVLFTIGQKVDDRVAPRLFDHGEGRSPARSIMSFPAGGMWYADIDLLGLVQALEAADPDTDDRVLPDETPYMQMAGWHHGDEAQFRVQVPRDLVQILIDVARAEGAGAAPAGAATPAVR